MSGPNKIAIVGGGKGGQALIKELGDDTSVEIVGLVDHNVISLGLREAELRGIPTYAECEELFAVCSPDIIINATGDRDLEKKIAALNLDKTEIISGLSANLMWQLIDKRQRASQKLDEHLSQFMELYHLGLALTSCRGLSDANMAVVECATKLTKTPAGSLAMVDEARGEMTLGAAKGFSPEFYGVSRWRLRQGGLTSYVLNQGSPVMVSDTARFKDFDNPVLVREGIRSLIASPLTVEGKIIGILYVDDFMPRKFGLDDVSVISLISNYAAMAIERIRMLEESRTRAITDSLTGLYNHGYFLSKLEEEERRAARYGHNLSLIMIDIDYFKKYNDNNGHQAGNEALREVACIIRDAGRQTDVCARCGGEEFALILPETATADALVVAERIREAVASKEFPGENEQPGGNFTVSLGVGSLPCWCPERLSVFKRADIALYRAKESGRNKTLVHECARPAELLKTAGPAAG